MCASKWASPQHPRPDFLNEIATSYDPAAEINEEAVRRFAELTEVTHLARRIVALLLLQPALDANYQAVKAASYVWPSNPEL